MGKQRFTNLRRISIEQKEPVQFIMIEIIETLTTKNDRKIML